VERERERREITKQTNCSVGKIAEKAVCRRVFDNIARYFECRINKNAPL